MPPNAHEVLPIRRLVLPAVIVLILLTTPALAQAPAPTLPAKPLGCDKTYTQRHLRHGARSVHRSPSKVTRREKATLQKMVRCARRSESRPAMRRTIRRWKRWRSSYEGVWRLASERLSSSTHATLRRLRGCETRGIAYPANYRYRGHHFGAYQYTPSTWARAGGHGSPADASKDEQDVRTARFFPSHRGEWACSA